MTDKFVIGLDYGTDSVRTLIVNANTGEEVATDVHYYSRWMEGKYTDPDKNQFRHHPLDYIEGLEKTVKACVNMVSDDVKNNIIAISVDTTGSTPCLTDKEGTPLSLLPEFQENPNGMFVLWKDHTSVKETAEINKLAKTWGGEDFTKYEGGVYSSEWFWSKTLHVLRNDEKIRKAAFSVVELCDWIPALLIGNKDALTIKRSRCAAGHKAMWHVSWGGLPSEEFLVKIDPLLKGFREQLYRDTYTSEVKVGKITSEWAQKLGLNEDVVVGVGAFDAHMGAIGAGIKSYSLVKIMGTSTCDIISAPNKDVEGKLIKGICGQVDGSVIPNMAGLEAGQSSFGDVYAWFKSLLYWPVKTILGKDGTIDEMIKIKIMKEIEEKIIPELEKEAAKLPIDEDGLIALDWFNGRRTPNANQFMKGAITGINLGSNAPKIYKSLIECTAYGARAINDCFEDQGVPIKEIIAIGGVSKKSDLVMQILADILNRPIKVCKSEQACALGAAMCAAVVGNIYTTIEEAQDHMISGFTKEYTPNPENIKKYDILYNKYQELANYMETAIMKDK
ncbi:MAG: ribulokinase [archaeon]|nr:ribulokinase [archaeon]